MPPLLLATAALVLGLLLLIWSADKFVDGASAVALHFAMPPLLVGMVIVGFGTSAPEMVVSAIAALEGNPALALGNGWGSNIVNIGLILGLTALLSPIAVHASVLRKELPILLGITLVSGLLLLNGSISSLDAWVLLTLFAALMGWTIYQGLQPQADAGELMEDISDHPMPLGRAWLWLGLGLLVLVLSSRLLVWGAVEIATSLGVSDLVIGLTVVAIGTSLPELAASIAAVRKGKHDMALGNVLGSNLFNTLAVVGIAGAIAPMKVDAVVLTRDWPVMAGLTAVLFLMGWGFRGRQGRIGRLSGLVLLLAYVAYTGALALSVIRP